MAREQRVRAPGSLGQREKGWFITFTDALPTLIDRLRVRNALQVFLRAYAIQHPDANINSLRVRQIVRRDYDAFYAGGQFPDYVFDTYTGEFANRLHAAE